MATNVGFLWGTAERLNTLKSSNSQQNPKFKQGTFYLTTDTHKLYFAQNDYKLVDLNQYIRLWTGNDVPSSTTDLPLAEVGDMYYLAARNILAIISSINNGTISWTQLNPDTYLTASTTAVSVESLANNGNGSEITTLVQDSGGRSASGSFQIVGGSNITVTTDTNNNKITLAATQSADHTYKITTTTTTESANAAKVNLYSVLDNAIASEGTLTISGAGIAKAYTDNNRKLTINVPARPITSVGADFDENGVLTIGARTADNTTTVTDSVTPGITYGNTPITTPIKFVNGTATLSVYTIDEVNNLLTTQLATANAMTYKGTINSASDATTKIGQVGSSAGTFAGNVGDTYKVNVVAGITSPVTAKLGDLVIAKGTDGAVTWDVVPSGDDQSISGSVSGTSVAISDSSGILAGITLAESTDTTKAKITLTGSQSGKVNTITVAHGSAGSAQTKLGSASGETAYTAVTSATTQSACSGASSSTYLSIPTIKGISYDGAGHIVSVTTGTYKVIDSHANISEVKFEIDNSLTAFTGTVSTTKTAKIDLSVKDTDSAVDVSTLAIATSNNSNISITRTTTTDGDNTIPTVVIDFVWGEF